MMSAKGCFLGDITNVERDGERENERLSREKEVRKR